MPNSTSASSAGTPTTERRLFVSLEFLPSVRFFSQSLRAAHEHSFDAAATDVAGEAGIAAVSYRLDFLAVVVDAGSICLTSTVCPILASSR
jgi:hypothetical protein